MKTIVTLFTSALVLLGVFALARAQTNSPRTFEERKREAERQTETYQKEVSNSMRVSVESRGQSWLTNYYGKTLSSLGEIVTIRIDRRERSTPDWTHRYLWQIIEESKMQDYPKTGSIPFNSPPVFTIEYSDGLRVQADPYNVLIVLPDGRKGSAFLTSKPQTP